MFAMAQVKGRWHLQHEARCQLPAAAQGQVPPAAQYFSFQQFYADKSVSSCIVMCKVDKISGMGKEFSAVSI